MIDKRSLGIIFASYRKQKNLTQVALAKQIGLVPSAIAHFEAGRRAPCLENFIKLVRGLDMQEDAIKILDVVVGD